MMMLNVSTILLTITGVLAQAREYMVTFKAWDICAVNGFNTSIPCTYTYPDALVTHMYWCFDMSHRDIHCVNPPYVYNSDNNIRSDFVYTGNNKSDCSLLILNVQFNYSGPYKFRFKTLKDKWTGEAVTLQVKALEVSEINLSGNGTLNEGDSVNLTCRLECAKSSSEFSWSKDDKQLQTGSVLHLPALTVKDSGTYTCTWRSNYSSGSKSFNLQVRGSSGSNLVLLLLVVGLLLVVLITVAVMYKKRKKVKAPEANSGKGGEKTQVEEDMYTKPLPRKVSEEKEITYASVSIQPSKPAKKHTNTKPKEGDDSVIYSTVKLS